MKRKSILLNQGNLPNNLGVRKYKSQVRQRDRPSQFLKNRAPDENENFPALQGTAILTNLPAWKRVDKRNHDLEYSQKSISQASVPTLMLQQSQRGNEREHEITSQKEPSYLLKVSVDEVNVTEPAEDKRSIKVEMESYSDRFTGLNKKHLERIAEKTREGVNKRITS